VRLLDQLGHSEFAGSVKGRMEKKLTLSGLHPGDVDVEDPNRVAFEPLASGLVSLDIRQKRVAVPRKTPMERRPRQVRDRGV
jgi:hypothetical protein